MGHGNNRSDFIILLRVHTNEPAVLFKADEILAQIGQVTLLVDETRGEIKFPSFYNKLSVNDAVMNQIGLPRHYNDTYRCGDYGLYVAKRAYPDCKFFWLIEPDVHINFIDIKDFFCIFSNADTDLITSWYERTDSGWWSQAEHMAPFSYEVYKCLFPVVRVSSQLILYLERRRIALGNQFRAYLKENRPSVKWPNDEVFVATEATMGSFKCRDMNDFGRAVYTKQGFKFSTPINFIPPPDGMLYHPVRETPSDYFADNAVAGR